MSKLACHGKRVSLWAHLTELGLAVVKCCERAALFEFQLLLLLVLKDRSQLCAALRAGPETGGVHLAALSAHKEPILLAQSHAW
eukprot:39166-Amphidinium_carterae.1